MKIPTNGPSRIYESPVRMGVKGQRGAWERGTTNGGNGWEQECGGALDQRWPLDHFTEGQLVQQGRTPPPESQITSGRAGWMEGGKIGV